MNTSLTAYTHLESLLLFQSLHAYGLENSVFSKISSLLKANPHIAADRRFQSGRLSPDALRNFYLHILKEELKSEQHAADGDVPPTNGDVKNSRKRKAPSPPLPTIQESVQHQHLIPKLVNKLYARYRTAITEQIRHEEDQYDRLQRELQGIERGEWDDQLREKANGKSAPLPSNDQSNAPPLQNGQTQPERSAKTAGSTSRKKQTQTPATKPSTPHPPLAPVPSPQQVQLPQAPAPAPEYASQPPPNPGSNGSPYPHRSPYPQAQAQIQPQNAQSMGNPHPPIQAPAPAPAPHLQAGNTPGPYLQPQPPQNFPGNGIPQFGPTPAAPPQFSPTNPRFPGPGTYQGPQSPSVHTPQPQPRHHAPYSGQSPYPPQQQMGQPPPPQGGFMLPPFQVSPQDPSRAHQQPMFPQHAQVSTPTNPRHTTKATPQSTNVGRPGLPQMHPLVTQVRHSFSTPTGMRTPQSAITTPRSAKSTVKRNWKIPADISRPEVSPIDDLVVLAPSSQQSQSKAKAPRKSRAKSKKEKELEREMQSEREAQSEEAVPEIETRQGRSRRKAPAKKTRPGSIASSQAGTSVRERSRSQSILSHTETVAADNESQTGSRVKSERGNSIDATEEDMAATPQRTTRRRGNLQQAHQSNKRKRNAREITPEEAEDRSGTPGLPKTVVALRQFSRMCAPLMNDISSHKHASIFTTAVRAKDAEGYYEIIKRPTDLKTIQKGIAAGAKQVTAAASGDTPAGSPGGGGAVVELSMTPDNIPPKAIVNSAQLEKELMRMFVNAVMFNAGEDGVVVDARETFESVQQSVSSWRSVERGSGRLEVEETPPVQEEDVPTASKRRKL
ncbi:hypothetical protein P280DRAFT_470752 [Massarina eburnea CBS 473.64]|uniref:Bromo domain-containing protein n=1 Tax=Massarina eburnea CBS 473.64 TaxID=1395130 RepID=A0A6A6RW55_9PLEO|nr:hypothetical protein P280DRAFT_470752 [Massarina eburnea CBS 473.64]